MRRAIATDPITARTRAIPNLKIPNASEIVAPKNTPNNGAIPLHEMPNTRQNNPTV